MMQDFEFSYLFEIPEKANQDDKLNKENISVGNIFSIHTSYNLYFFLTVLYQL